MLLADDFGKTFVEANKDAIGKMVLEAVKKMATKQKPSKKASETPNGKISATNQTPPAAATPRKRKNADSGGTPSSKKPRAAAADNTAKARAARATLSTSQPGDDPAQPGGTKSQTKRSRRRKLAMDQEPSTDDQKVAAQRDSDMQQRDASGLPTGVVSATWAAASQTPGIRNNPTANAAKRRQKQLEKAADAVTDALALSNPAPEELRSAARLAAPFSMLAPEVSELNERADALEKAERTRLQEQAQKEAAERQRKQQEAIHTEKIKALRAERAEIAKQARAARRAQQARDEKLREWEEERRAVEEATWHANQELDLDDPIPEEA